MRKLLAAQQLQKAYARILLRVIKPDRIEYRRAQVYAADVIRYAARRRPGT